MYKIKYTGYNFLNILIGLGNKKHPVHLLVLHGTFKIKNAPSINRNDILTWLDGCKEGKIEGIVWHCPDGNLIKVILQVSLRNCDFFFFNVQKA